MDILLPELVSIDGRCYRFCDSSAWSQSKELGAYQEDYFEQDYEVHDEESCDSSIEIIPDRGNRLKHSFYVNSHFFKFIIGSKGATLKRLGSETNTKIIVPKFGQDGDVVITGIKRRDITAARHRIDLLIETSRSKLEFTHFVSFPTNSDEIKENFIKFKESILKNCSKGARGIQEETFQKPEKLHITLIMLVLLDEEDRKKSIEALESCKKYVISPVLEQNGPITVELRGVEIMNDDPSEAHILYIQAHDQSGGLQEIANRIADHFINQGLTRRQYDRVKLHITAMNTKFLMKDTQDYRKKKETFDATSILKTHKDTYFGTMNVSSIRLCQRHYATSKDGFYLTTAKIDL